MRTKNLPERRANHLGNTHGLGVVRPVHEPYERKDNEMGRIGTSMGFESSPACRRRYAKKMGDEEREWTKRSGAVRTRLIEPEKAPASEQPPVAATATTTGNRINSEAGKSK